MKERIINGNQFFISNYEPSEVSDPGKRSFYNPSAFISSQFSSILKVLFFAISTMRSNKIDAFIFEISSKWITVIGLISDQTIRSFFRSAWSVASDFNCLKSLLNQFHFRGRCRGKGASHRNTLAVCHHHPLRSLAPPGFPDAEPPFLAGAKLPSMKDSDQSKAPLASNWARKARQTSSQTPFSSQSFSLLQQVEELGYLDGRSHHLAPVRKIHNMPSKTSRFGARGLPPFLPGFGLGNKGSIFFHCSSLINFLVLVIGSPPMTIYRISFRKSSFL